MGRSYESILSDLMGLDLSKPRDMWLVTSVWPLLCSTRIGMV